MYGAGNLCIDVTMNNNIVANIGAEYDIYVCRAVGVACWNDAYMNNLLVISCPESKTLPPSKSPTVGTVIPTNQPTVGTSTPTNFTLIPTDQPSNFPTKVPTNNPSLVPTVNPTKSISPSEVTIPPTLMPSPLTESPTITCPAGMSIYLCIEYMYY